MDMITLAMAKKYTDQKTGYVEWTHGRIDWDGDPADKLSIPFDELGFETWIGDFVKISDKPILANNITGVSMYGPDGSVASIYAPGDFRVEDLGGAHIVSTGSNGTPLVFVIDDGDTEMDGVYFAAFYTSQSKDNVSAYIGAIIGNITETIHTIDPKFIPGVCLPVVDFITEPVEEGATLTDEEIEMLQYAASKNLPIIARFTKEGMQISTNMLLTKNDIASIIVFGAYLGDGSSVSVGLFGGVWEFTLRL